MEIYEYTSYIPDGTGKYTEVTSTVSIPHEASIGLIDLSDYENIAEDYSVLPSISGSVLTHTIGDPSSYPSAPSAGSKAYNGDPAKVDFTAAGGGSGITQEISFSTSDSKAQTPPLSKPAGGLRQRNRRRCGRFGTLCRQGVCQHRRRLVLRFAAEHAD